MSSQGTLSFRKPSANPKISNTYNQRNPRPLLPRSSQRPTSQPRGTPSPHCPERSSLQQAKTYLFSQTDSTRASDLELHIQRRVAAELERLSTEASQQLSQLSESISAPEPTAEWPHSESTANPSIASGAVFASGKEGDRKSDLGRQSVQKEIDGLKKKLQQRRIKEEVVGDKGVVKAKEGVVKCLRENDRRPLDCWREVEAFKGEVGRLEKGFWGRGWD